MSEKAKFPGFFRPTVQHNHGALPLVKSITTFQSVMNAKRSKKVFCFDLILHRIEALVSHFGSVLLGSVISPLLHVCIVLLLHTSEHVYLRRESASFGLILFSPFFRQFTPKYRRNKPTSVVYKSCGIQRKFLCVVTNVFLCKCAFVLLLLLVCTIARSPKCIFDGVKKKDIVADKPELIIVLCPVVDHHYPYLLHEKSGFITRQMKLKKRQQ